MRKRSSTLTIFGILTLVASAVAPAPAQTGYGPIGSVSGVIAESATAPGLDLSALPQRHVISVETTGGRSVGRVSYGAVRAGDGGTNVLPYRVDRLPLGVELDVTAQPAPAANATPSRPASFCSRISSARSKSSTARLRRTCGVSRRGSPRRPVSTSRRSRSKSCRRCRIRRRRRHRPAT